MLNKRIFYKARRCEIDNGISGRGGLDDLREAFIKSITKRQKRK
jgi:hypothetical protein